MSVLHYVGADGELVPVSAGNPLPTAGGAVGVGTAVADATDEASAVTQLNALLASLRTAGLIAT